MSTARTSSTPSSAQAPRQGQPTQTAQTHQTTSSGTKLSGERIAQRAYEKWLKRGCVHGYDQQDWVEAEKELLAEQGRSTSASSSAPPPPSKTRR